MMELEKFLRDKNMPLEMGVGLGSYVASLEAGKKVVKCFGSPTRKQWTSSYMSSSIMWASGVGKQHGRGRVQQRVIIIPISHLLSNISRSNPVPF